MKRVPRYISMDLIQYCKRVDVVANFWKEDSRSAIEFARQMGSRKLKRVNPTFECLLTLDDDAQNATIIAEYTNGLIWKKETAGCTADALRNEFFDVATIAEEELEDKDEDADEADSTNDSDGKVSGKK